MSIKPPPVIARMLEGRVALEAAAVLAQLPMLRLRSPRGRGPVMVLPGFMMDDATTWLLRRFLNSLGYDVRGWGLGVNRGALARLVDALVSELRAWHTGCGATVQLVGWSRGGMVARELARRAPEAIGSVITMGTPIAGGPGASSIGGWALRSAGISPADATRMQLARESVPIKCPVHSIYSKSDGVVAWEASIDGHNRHAEHHEVMSSHAGMGSHPEIYVLLARILAKYC
ncbi:MAG: esterase [Pseudomonadales bacterium]